MTVLLTLRELPRDDDDEYSTIGLMMRTVPLKRNGTSATQVQTSSSDGNAQAENKHSDEDKELDDFGGRQV